MSGAIGPTVAVHTPLASFCRARGSLKSSLVTFTSDALGACRRNVTCRSAEISGERIAGGRCATQIDASSRVMEQRFICIVSFTNRKGPDLVDPAHYYRLS